jgi:uncharacterized RmlC-like cupin family protein
MAKAAPKKKSSAKKAARTSAKTEAPVKKKAAPAKSAAKKAAPKKAAPKKAAVAKAPAKRPVGRPPAKKKAAAATTGGRPVGRPPGKKAAVKATAKRPVGRPPGKKKAAAAKSTAAKVAAKRPVGRPPGGKKAAAPAKRGRPAAKKAAVQSFTVSHLNEADFKADGLRSYAHYRDLGIAAATGGLCQAHVIRLIPPCTDEVRKRHIHETELQLIYVLKGWIKNEFEGHGAQMMSAGTCWLQPPGIKHTVLDYSADCEMLEIIVPADFKTTEVA